MPNTDPAWEYAQATTNKGTAYADGGELPPGAIRRSEEFSRYLHSASSPPPHDPDKPFPTPLLGYPVRRINKSIPQLSAKRNAVYENTLIVDTYGYDGFEQVVVNWTILEELIDEVVEYRRLIAHCRGLDEA